MNQEERERDASRQSYQYTGQQAPSLSGRSTRTASTEDSVRTPLYASDDTESYYESDGTWSSFGNAGPLSSVGSRTLPTANLGEIAQIQLSPWQREERAIEGRNTRIPGPSAHSHLSPPRQWISPHAAIPLPSGIAPLPPVRPFDRQTGPSLLAGGNRERSDSWGSATSAGSLERRRADLRERPTTYSEYRTENTQNEQEEMTARFQQLSPTGERDRERTSGECTYEYQEQNSQYPRPPSTQR